MTGKEFREKIGKYSKVWNEAEGKYDI